MEVKLSDLYTIYNEIKKNVKNKKKIAKFENHKVEYIIDIKNTLESGNYNGGIYNIFLVFKPKIRVVMSQSIYDKIINHYFTRFILMPKLTKYLNYRNCATRTNMGLDYAIKLLKKELENFKKFDNFYILKMDLSKYFYSISHQKIIEMFKNDLEDDELQFLKIILNSTNKKYINERIAYYEKKFNIALPHYKFNYGIPIGNLSSQFLAIIYLSKLQHYMIANLHLRFVNYMDDYVIIHHDKNYLKKILGELSEIITNEYSLKLNQNKTVIYRADKGFEFLGYRFIINNKKTIIKLTKKSKTNIKKGVKRAKYNFQLSENFEQYFCSIQTYKNSYKFTNKKEIKNVFKRYY